MASALIALSSCGDIPVVTVREDDVIPTYARSVHMCGKYDYYLGITWSPANITAELHAPHIANTLLQDWNGGFFTEPIPSTYLLELFFSARPEKVTYVGVYTAEERRPHRNNNIICFQVAGKTYYAAQNGIVSAHPVALGWHFHKSPRTVSVQQLMYGPLPQPQ